MSDYGWENDKAASNNKKHKVSFEEAVEVFTGPLIYFGEDKSEDYDEVRLVAAGLTRENRLLFVVFNSFEEEDGGEFTKIIHAKDFERSHLKHFEDPNDRRELTALLESCKGPRAGRR